MWLNSSSPTCLRHQNTMPRLCVYGPLEDWPGVVLSVHICPLDRGIHSILADRYARLRHRPLWWMSKSHHVNSTEVHQGVPSLVQSLGSGFSVGNSPETWPIMWGLLIYPDLYIRLCFFAREMSRGGSEQWMLDRCLWVTGGLEVICFLSQFLKDK